MLLRILSDPFAIVLVVLFFGASIFLHELGHFLAARWRGLHVDRFSIGFGPRLFGWKDKHGVDWRVSLIPLGGYVSLPQLADLRGVEGESSVPTSQLPPISYADKMIVAAAGAVFNVLFALALGTVLWMTGLPVNEELETTTVGYVAETMIDEDGMEREGPAFRAGLQPGDQIISIDGDLIKDWEDITYAITTGVRRSASGNPRTDVEILRNGETLSLEMFPVLDEFEGIRRIGIAPANTLRIGGIMENSPAELTGLLPGDEIVAANGQALFHTITLSQQIRDAGQEPLQLEVLREGSVLAFPIQAEQVAYNTNGDTVPMIGVRWERVSSIRHINPFAQIADAMSVTFRVLGALLHPRSDIGINNLSGPVGISYTLYIVSQIGLLEVLSIVVLININLAILNLLPIPVLDGGHMAFATIAKLRGRPIPLRIIASAQGAFMIFFLGIFVYVTFFDVGRVQRNESAISEAEEAAAQRIPIEFSGQAQPDQPAP
jgi:regulator of sigma E protease